MESQVFFCKEAECKLLYQSISAHNEHKSKMVEVPPSLSNKFNFMRKLGQGAFAAVFEVMDISDKKTKALKLMENTDDNKNVEIDILSGMHYQYLIKYFSSGRIDDITFILMEMCDHDLEDYIKNKKPSDEEKLKTFLQICKAVLYLHSKCEVAFNISFFKMLQFLYYFIRKQ